MGAENSSVWSQHKYPKYPVLLHSIDGLITHTAPLLFPLYNTTPCTWKLPQISSKGYILPEFQVQRQLLLESVLFDGCFIGRVLLSHHEVNNAFTQSASSHTSHRHTLKKTTTFCQKKTPTNNKQT